jgi:hypothetical protein
MISFTCPCGNALLADNEQATQKMPCPACGRVLDVPVAEHFLATSGGVPGAPLDGVRTTAAVNRAATTTARDAPLPSPRRRPIEDDRLTNKLPATGFDAAAIGHRLAGNGCPCCGSTAFTQMKPVKGALVTADRQCKTCGAGYLTIPAPVSGTLQAAMYTCGAVLILGGLLAAGLQLAATQGPGPLRPTFHLYGVIFSLMVGFNMFRLPHQIQEHREKRWQDYKASAPPDAPPPVELSRAPDAVSLSILFGTLSLAAPLFSSLLTVVVFGPAALVSGAVAVAQGHAKGVVGLLLGAAGLTVWGLVFVFMILHGA